MICLTCGKPTGGRAKTCARCRQKKKAKRDAHTALGLCSYYGCHQPRSAGTRLCQQHREYYRLKHLEARAKAKEARRAAWLEKASLTELLQDYDAVL